MESLKSNRIIIASLFLPQGTVYYDDDRSPRDRSKPPPPIENRPATTTAGLVKALQVDATFSIVDDLTKQTTSPQDSPVEDKSNPFSAFTSPRLGPQTNVRPLPSRLPALNLAPTGVIPARSIVVGDKSNSETGLVVTPTTPTARSRPRRPSRTASRSSSLRRSSSVVRPSPRVGFLDAPHYTPWQIEASSHGNIGLFNAVNSVPDVIQRKLWVGIIDSPTDDFPDELRVDLELKYQAEHDSLPVWITDAEFSGCYDVYCHQVLWPTLHYAVPDAPKTRANLYDSKSFDQYAAVNKKFAEAIISTWQEGDIIMVNDYHLMLLPQLIREKIPQATIGFFLHVTFPSSEIFRCLAARQHLLRGMLGADLVAFQTYNHMRHFRQTVHRILSLEAVPKGIQLENGFVDVQAMPMGIDLAGLYLKKKDPEVQEWITNLKERYAGVQLIVGRDKLDEVQGVRQKVVAFERLLEKYPEFQGKVVLIQVALATTSEVETIASERLTSTISRVNSRFSTLSYTPVVLLHTNELNFYQYLALLSCADAFLVTSLREGMALRTHEFIECQEERKRPLILSEFTGSYSSGFRSCFVINPYDATGSAEAIKAALTISDAEATRRWQDLHKHVITQTAQNFVSSFLTRTKRAHAEHTARPHASIPVFPTGDMIETKYKPAKKRLFLLGLENTLVLQEPKAMKDRGFQVPDEIVELLRKIASDERNVVYILSGLPVETALDKLAEALPNVGFVAENGCFVKPRPRPGEKSEWVNLIPGMSMAWKEPCINILHYFSERTPGSFIEERKASIRWRYWPGNPDDTELPWARRQAAEAQNHIWDSLGEKFGLRIVPATRSFLVLPGSASRYNATEWILGLRGAEFGDARPPPPHPAEQFEFKIAIGNDERLLGRLNSLPGCETVSTSLKNSDAKWSLTKPEVVKELWRFANEQ